MEKKPLQIKFAILLFSVLLAFQVQGQTTFTVTNTNDAGTGSLRAAITSANATAAQDTIKFIGITYPATITLTSGQLVIDSSLIIIGPGADSLAISGNNASRVFTVNDTTVMNGLTIKNGQDGSFDGGGGVYNISTLTQTNCTMTNNSVTNGNGGGIYNGGTLTQTNCTMANNSAISGGGIFNSGTLTQTNCTMANNSATNNGGGIENYGTLTQINCTMVHNSANNEGGGILNNDTLIQTNCTMANNSALDGGGIYNSSTLTLINTLLNGNDFNEYYNYATITSLGNNISPDNSLSSYLIATGDMNNTNPLLDTLKNNGGPTKTCALLAGSPAINAGTATGAPPTDQRGYARNGKTDIGAYEYNGCNGPNLSSLKIVSNTYDAGCGSLRQAIIDANLDAKQDTIIFSGITYPDSIVLTSGQLTITQNLVILGPGADSLAISGNHASRVFTVNATTVMNGLTIKNGNAGFGFGGGIYNSSTLTQTNCTMANNSAADGGGIENYSGGIFTQTNCTMAQNSASYNGGGIYNSVNSTLTQTNCTMVHNLASSVGGGIENYGTLNQSNCTMANNSATYGGGIENYSALTQTNCTMAYNLASNGGGVHNYGAITLKNTLLNGNDVYNNTYGGSITSLGNNISPDNSLIANLTATGDMNNTNPLLDTLKNNGGPTKTCALLAGSPAINAGSAAGSPVIDQRGYARNGNTDIGAYEYNGCVTAFNNLALALSNNNASTAGKDTVAQNQVDGSTIYYLDNTCGVIASVVDALGGNVLGNTTVIANVESTVPTLNGQPYSPRWFNIIPTNQGPATVTIYQTQADFNNFNLNKGTYPAMPTNAADTAGIANIRVTEVHKGNTTQLIIPSSIAFNSATNYWSIVVPVDSFSDILVDTKVTSFPLSFALKSFAVAKQTTSDFLSWSTASENNNQYFTVQKSTDAVHFDNIGYINSQATNGNSSQELSYRFVDSKPSNGVNYYRLQQTNINGKTNIASDVKSVVWNSNQTVATVYPNPATTTLNIAIQAVNAANTTIKLMDMTGRIIAIQTTITTQGSNLLTMNLSDIVAGLYTIQIEEDQKVILVNKVFIQH